MNLFTDSAIGPMFIILFIIVCLSGIYNLIKEMPDVTPQTKKKVRKEPKIVYYQNYTILEDGTIVYPAHINEYV